MVLPDYSGILHAGSAELADRAASLARRFGLKALSEIPSQASYLYLGDTGLQLCRQGNRGHSPVSIDFCAGHLDHRRRFGGGRGQPLARAVGMKPGFSPHILDATAGLGRDAFVFASCGCRVTLCERSPLLAALLDDTLSRARTDDELGAWIGDRMQLVFDDARNYLKGLQGDQRPQVVYLDPMYPPRRGSALVKKEMQALQHLLGPDTDSSSLLESALASARRRVVVKRPGGSHWLAGRKPSASIDSRSTRYDIYVTL